MTTRQQLIVDLVKKYKTEYKDEYKFVCKIAKDKRGKLKDRRAAMVQGGFMRPSLYFPQVLFNWLDFALDNPRFMDDSEDGSKELRWFAKKFPEFVIPSQI